MKFLKTIGVIIMAALVGLLVTWFVAAGDLNFFGWEKVQRVGFLLSEVVIIMAALIAAEQWGWV